MQFFQFSPYKVNPITTKPQSTWHYATFGSPMPTRSWSDPNAKYKYGFNGKEKDNEVNVDGGDYDFGARIYDSRLGRWLSLDPLMGKYAWYTPYQFAGNKPILFIDIKGLEETPAVKPEIQTNIIIVVLTAEDIVKGFIGQYQDGVVGDYYIIYSSDIVDGANRAKSYLGDVKANNIVIACHGLTNTSTAGSPYASLLLSPTGNDTDDAWEAISSFTIADYIEEKTKSQTPKLKTAALKDVEALDKIMDLVSDNGNLVFAGCNAGKDPVLCTELALLGEKRFNIFLNKDASAPQSYQKTDSKLKTTLSKIDFSTDVADFKLGWVKIITSTSTPASLMGKDDNTGNIKLDTTENTTPVVQTKQAKITKSIN